MALEARFRWLPRRGLLPTARTIPVVAVRVLPGLLLAALGVLAGGCSTLVHRDAIEDLRAFEPLPQSAQVRFAPAEAERFARRVAVMLPAATARVEAVHGRPFQAPPVVYVCGDDACFDRFVDRRWNFTAAVVYDNRLVLAPRLFDREPERLVPILLHELSHLHLGQRRGHYSMSIPIWFHEGLASLVAEGGGADLVTDAEAWSAAASARHFVPDQQHLPWQRRRAETWKLSVSLFYRQAFLFLRGLQTQDAAAFDRLLEALQDGADFDAAFAQAFHVNPAHAASAFFATRHCTGSSDSASCERPAACCPARLADGAQD
jgi:hypothetical protein